MMAKLKKMKWCSVMLSVLMLMVGFSMPIANAGEYTHVYDGHRHVGTVETGKTWTGQDYVKVHEDTGDYFGPGGGGAGWGWTVLLLQVGGLLLYNMMGGDSSNTSNSNYNGQSYGR